MDAGPAQSKCKNDPAVPLGARSTLLGARYRWQPAAGLSDTTVAAPLARPDATTRYTVFATLGPCTVSDTVTVYVRPQPQAAFFASPAMGQRPVHVVFSNGSTLASSYAWVFDLDSAATTGSAEFAPSHTYFSPGRKRVRLIASNPIGCTDTATAWIDVLGDTSTYCLFVPNAFTPNDDAINPNWHIVHCGFTDFELQIYDRWGGMRYQAFTPDFKWDGNSNGKPVPEGPYYFRISYTDHTFAHKSQYGVVYVFR